MALKAIRIPRSVTNQIGYYVYLYLDPRNRRPFYVGKGKGTRALAHLVTAGGSKKVAIIRELQQAGRAPQIDILAHGLSEDAALRLESAAIDLLKLEKLSNRVRGWRSVELGRMPLRQLIAYYRPIRVCIDDRVILIRINKLYKHGMSKPELYEATRGVWKVNQVRVSKAKYALAVFAGVVREVYEILNWYPAGTTKYQTRSIKDVKIFGRREFTGQIAKEPLRRRYLDRSVEHYLPNGLRSPIVYINV